jgi:hypothetical protein
MITHPIIADAFAHAEIDERIRRAEAHRLARSVRGPGRLQTAVTALARALRPAAERPQRPAAPAATLLRRP